MPHPRAKVRTQMPLPWDVLDKQMPRGGCGGGGGGWARLDLTHALETSRFTISPTNIVNACYFIVKWNQL